MEIKITYKTDAGYIQDTLVNYEMIPKHYSTLVSFYKLAIHFKVIQNGNYDQRLR